MATKEEWAEYFKREEPKTREEWFKKKICRLWDAFMYAEGAYRKQLEDAGKDWDSAPYSFMRAVFSNVPANIRKDGPSNGSNPPYSEEFNLAWDEFTKDAPGSYVRSGEEKLEILWKAFNEAR